MPRILSAALTREKNQIESTHAWTMAFEVSILGAPAPYRLVNYDQEVVFHGLAYLPFPVDVDALNDATSMALVRLRVTVGNVDQAFQSLLENYWGPDTPWIVTIWQMDATQPDETPFGAGEVFTIVQVSTDLVSAVVDAQAEGITLSGMIPKRRFTSAGGFGTIPRRF